MNNYIEVKIIKTSFIKVIFIYLYVYNVLFGLKRFRFLYLENLNKFLIVLLIV